ncbi:penicillin-binding protein 1B [Thalassolituus alkanivorans]|uniref:penicillin-binding protein 1B n=1 Tax=Thalassolituus alkanivorans TaxID=2881055 RepID=UPI001E3DE4F5|nr:penicillin-binding protein 1B [Thalassolituus alkanivorans]MCB2423097.1 penicillin-binding protein 1B [Thalassolituus alkanivorans]
MVSRNGKKTSRSPSAKRSASRRPAARNQAKAWPRWLVWLLRLMLVGLVLTLAGLVYLDAQVRAKFDGNKWTLPAKVFARPLALYPGLLLSPEQLKAELEWADYREQAGAVRPGSYYRDGDDWVVYRRAFPFWDGQEPARKLRLEFARGRVSNIVEDGDDQALVRLEPQYIGGIFPAHNEDRELVKLEQIPPALVAALIVTEDKAFFDHWGVSLRGIARAMLANVKAGGFVQGGSTLTQQLVKNFFLTSERTLARKVQEALMALLLELHYSKEQILQAYLNEVYLGQAGRRAIHGFGLASRFYFGKQVQELSTAEIATLVGLVKGASYYNPRRNPERSKQRRDLILGLMAENGIISDAQRILAQGQPLVTADSRRAGQREYPAFLELAKAQLQRDYRLEDLQSEGLHIFTTLDPWAQHAVEQAAERQLAQLESRSAKLKGQLETAAVITSVDGGEVRALLGSRQAEFFGFNRALAAKRAIGSLAKPVVYLTALQSGRYHWGTPLEDKPVSVSGPGGQLWQPQNYDHRSHGVVPMVDGLALSLNQATARLGMKVGLSNVAATFHKLGLQAEVPPYPSMLLGAISLSPYEVAGMYQTIASQGFVMPLRSIEAVTTAQGQTLSSYALRGEQAFDPALMQWLRYGMEQVAERGTARRLTQVLNGPLAAKTGTSDDQRDAWFAGFDNRYLGIIWVGRDDNQPMPFAGSSAALPIWLDTFRTVGSEPLLPASALRSAAVNERGELVGGGCRGTLYPFISSRLPASLPDCQPLQPEPAPEEKKSWFDWLF